MNSDIPETQLPATTPTTTPDRGSKIGQVWLALGIFAVVLILLIIFILQNNFPVTISYLGFSGSLPFGVAMLIAAVAGSILTLLIGSIRILQLKAIRKRDQA